MRSEIEIQLLDCLSMFYFASLETPQFSVASPYHVFLEEHVFSE